MAWTLARLSCLFSISVTASACTRANPGFGDDNGGSGESSTASESDSLDPSATMSASTSVSTSNSAETGETGTPDAACGNDVLESGEECDEGEKNREEGNCRPDCRINKCGDGHIGPGQGCDDGNDIDDDECSNECVARTCNNGMLDEGEQCDPTAQLGDLPCTPVCQHNVCHDGFKLGENEQCDDGNVFDDDSCVGECVPATCGDGYTHTGNEACDDANADNTDGCVGCAEAFCGDGFVHDGVEGCEPTDPESYACLANGFAGGVGACSNTCAVVLDQCNNCGDNVTDFEEGEQCDFGAKEAMFCEDLGWVGAGSVACAGCIAMPVNCCAPIATPCTPDAGMGEGICCGFCDPKLFVCANEN